MNSYTCGGLVSHRLLVYLAESVCKFSVFQFPRFPEKILKCINIFNTPSFYINQAVEPVSIAVADTGGGG